MTPVVPILIGLTHSAFPDDDDDFSDLYYVPIPLVLLNGRWSDSLASDAWYRGPLAAACLRGMLGGEDCAEEEKERMDREVDMLMERISRRGWSVNLVNVRSTVEPCLSGKRSGVENAFFNILPTYNSKLKIPT